MRTNGMERSNSMNSLLAHKAILDKKKNSGHLKKYERTMKIKLKEHVKVKLEKHIF